MSDKLGTRLADKQRQINELKKQLKSQKIDYEVLSERLVATEQDRDYWRDKYRLIQKGALVYVLDQDGYIMFATNIPNDFLTSFAQDAPSEIGSRAYNANRFYKIENGIIVKDNDRYKKYIGGIV